MDKRRYFIFIDTMRNRLILTSWVQEIEAIGGFAEIEQLRYTSSPSYK